MTTIRALGPLTLVRDNVELLVPMDAAGRLLRFLVAAGGQAPVEEVVEALWPEAPRGAGFGRMRNLLSRTRKAWGEIVVRDGALLHWAPGVVVDVDLFEAEAADAIRSGDVELGLRALHRWRGELMPVARYADWAVLPRERIRRLYVRLLRFVGQATATRGDTDAGIEFVELALALDPDDESHYLLAADLLLDAGRPGAARRFIERARKRNEQLGVPDSAGLAQTVARIQLTS